MATSGSVDFIVTRDDIITEALEHLGVLGEGQTPSADQLTSCSRTLNMMVKAWQAEGMNLSTLQRTYLFLEKNKSEYTLSSTGDNWTTFFVSTQTAAAANSGDSTLTVDSITGVSSGDYIGIQLDDGTMQWTTVNSAPSGTTIPLTATLTSTVAIDNYVYVYTSKANKPAGITSATVKKATGNETTVELINNTDYTDLSTKDSSGQVNQIWFKKEIADPKLFVWPQTNVSTDYLVLWVQRTFEDFDAAGDNPDFPQEYYMALSTGLAASLGFKYGTPAGLLDRLMLAAERYKEEAMGFDSQDYISFSPDFQGQR